MSEIFSLKTIRMFEDNDFSVTKEGSFVTFKKVIISKAMLLIPAFFLSLIAVVHLEQEPLIILVVILLISLFTKVIWVRLTRKLHFQIDFFDNTFKFYDHKRKLHWSFLNEIEEVTWKSYLTTESKSTNKEYEIAISVKMNNNQVFTVFQFGSDYAEPSPEIIEVFTFLGNATKNIKAI